MSFEEFTDALYAAGWTSRNDAQHEHVRSLYDRWTQAIADEREACAKACQDQIHQLSGKDSLLAGACRGWINNCIAAIRQRTPPTDRKAI